MTDHDTDHETPIEVVAEITPGRIDHSTRARFANSDRALAYAQIQGDHSEVLYRDTLHAGLQVLRLEHPTATPEEN